MPKKANHPSVADEQAAPGGAAAVDRAICLLAAFRAEDKALSVTQLAERTRLYKSTVLRLLASLAHGGLMRRTPDGRWALGPEIGRLAALPAARGALEDLASPLMQALVLETGESVALHVRDGAQRRVLLRVDSPQLLRDHVRAGDILPLDRGAGGRVLLAFSGATGEPYDHIRRLGHAVLAGDRVPGLTGISAPVWQAGDQLAGALTLTVPETRFREAMTAALCSAAQQLSQCLGGREAAPADAPGHVGGRRIAPDTL